MTETMLLTGLVLLTAALYQTDCTVYHVSFLGRQAGGSQNKIGELHFQGNAQDVSVINEVGCNWEIETPSTNIKKIVPKENCQGLIPSGTGLAATGLKVESQEDFILHVYQSYDSGTLADGYLAIPDEHLGKEYYINTYCSLGGFCQFAVTGTNDRTKVNIVFPNHLSAGAITCNGISLPDNAPSGEPIAFTLHENEVLHIEGNQSKVDLSGTYIASNENVAVFVGARDVPSARGTFLTSMIEQIPPVNNWGTDFVVAPNFLNDAGDIIKIITQSKDTTVHILGFSPFTISNKGETTERRIDWEMHSSVIATKPILIVQVMSLHLYNDTSIVAGSPAMVLVPHVKQWSDREVFSDCLQKAINTSILTVVVNSSKSSSLFWKPSFNGPWTIIATDDYSVFRVGPTSPETKEIMSQGINRGAYGYCGGNSAVLLVAKWDWENEECVPTIPVPGDGVDNDCNGEIDEESCTIEDLRIKFTSTQNAATGGTTFKSFSVNGASPITFHVKSCDIAIVSLQTTTEPGTIFTVQITPSNGSMLVCNPECIHASFPINNENCEVEKTFGIGWVFHATNQTTTHAFRVDNLRQEIYIEEKIDYDMMFLTAFSQTAEFVVDLPEKDCGKIKSGDFADSFGFKFMLPNTSPDQSTTLFLTNDNNEAVNVTLFGDGEPQDVNILPNTTFTKEMPSISTIEAENEISVYLIRVRTDGKTFGHTILPVDVLGPNYQVFNDENTVLAEFPYDRKTGTELEDLGVQKVYTANKPFALFWGTADSMTQIPPRETLGKQHYIPLLLLDKNDEEAQLTLVGTEDSTIVVIKGNYDNLDTVNLTGNSYTRAVENNMLYNITATKPIQVHLQLRKKGSEGWSSSVVIPPIEQYTSEHIFPGMEPQPASITYRTTVSETGVTNVIETPIAITSTVGRFQHETKSFSLAVHSYNDKRVIIPSNVMYQEINTVCKITKGTPGDGKDNDCDGLIDEEECTANIVPGNIDADIDGTLNEDCAEGTSAPAPTAITLSLPSTEINCPTDSGSSAGTGGATDGATDDEEETGQSVTIDNGMLKGEPQPTVKQPPVLVPLGSGPTYAPIQSKTLLKTSSQVTTTVVPGSTAAPEETCVADCICPCGWVNPPRNYTPEELKAKVVEIQEKLKVSKNSLSAKIRSLTSAKDDRSEAAAVGMVGVVFLVVVLGSMILLDVTTIARDLKMMVGNLRQMYEP